jgi:predicted RNase H-like HicB family nuclease
MADATCILSVYASWDSNARVWVAVSDDVPGLVAEASSLDELFSELQTLIPELLELNGLANGDPAAFQLVAINNEAGMAAA